MECVGRLKSTKLAIIATKQSLTYLISGFSILKQKRENYLLRYPFNQKKNSKERVRKCKYKEMNLIPLTWNTYFGYKTLNKTLTRSK